MNICPICQQESLIYYRDNYYCSNYFCLTVYPKFIYYFLQQLKRFFYDIIIDRFLLANILGYWKTPIEIFNLTTLPFKNNDPLWNFCQDDLNEYYINRYLDGLMLLPAFNVENIILSMYYPTLSNQNQQLEYISPRFFYAKSFFNQVVTEGTQDPFLDQQFYSLFFLSPTIQTQIHQLLTWRGFN